MNVADRTYVLLGGAMSLATKETQAEFVVVQDLDKQPNYGWKPVTRKTRKDGFKIVEQQILS